jgi:hypothetical protein
MMTTMKIARLSRRSQPGYRFTVAFGLGLALVVSGAPSSGRAGGIVSAQALNACTLLMGDEIHPRDEKVIVASGVAESFPDVGYTACRYTWGAGVDRFRLDVIVTDASRVFPGLSPEQMKQRILESVRTGTEDAVVSEIGEAAIFKPESPVFANATALVKGRILQVQLDGVYAGEMKGEVVGLLKTAASRL